MKVLYAVSEAVPFVKTGGLADVAGSLPKALREQGADVRVVLPLYGSIGSEWRLKMNFCFYTFINLAWRRQYCGVFSLEYDGLVWYFIDNEYYFKRDGIYGCFDDGERFAFFSRAVLDVLPLLDWQPEIISCNDWQTALIPIYAAQDGGGIKTVFTIHNIEYQGRFGTECLSDVFGLSDELFSGGILRYEDGLNLMKGAIYKADRVTTVSPSYAHELHDPFFANGLDRVVEDNAYKLTGILNGLDTVRYDPMTDVNLSKNYGPDKPEGKAACRVALCRELGLEESDTPIIACVSRLVSHKGFDLVEAAFDRIVSRGAKFIILGTGEEKYESFFRRAEDQYKGRVSANIMYSDKRASLIYAGADMMLMPSRSEPCGLTQMIAMRYGTVPVVREVGGLRDSVRPYPSEDSTGFTFCWYSADDMASVLGYAIDIWYDKDKWSELVARDMSEDLSWSRSANEYKKIYESLI